MKSRIWTILAMIFFGLSGIETLYPQEVVSQTLETKNIETMMGLPFIAPLHQGIEFILHPKDLSPNLEEAFGSVRAVFEPTESNSQDRKERYGGDFGDLVQLEFESFAPIVRKLQEIRLLQAYESASKDYTWFRIVLFSEPETLNLVVYLEKEENRWKITGVDRSSPN